MRTMLSRRQLQALVMPPPRFECPHLLCMCWRLHGTHYRIVKRRDEPFALLLHQDPNAELFMWRHFLAIGGEHPAHFVSLVEDGDVRLYESDAQVY